MPKFVRVTDKATGHKFSIPRERYDANPDAFRELKQDATAPNGTPLPPEYKTTDVAPASVKQAGSTANTTKE